eukprot:CAMPEP_0172805918 /NCGR_PEP_ID=MMETSP1075-20121228/6016_1 /TAXON_ID=2916 /ORGANISM="Ceratium fusus, Strain PA161109" /LENGTH=96 /DNA_ID=CAMNT_0013644631 /DNA_START=419 /DNA_END=706 /DNA_ORIENTATION=-
MSHSTQLPTGPLPVSWAEASAARLVKDDGDDGITACRGAVVIARNAIGSAAKAIAAATVDTMQQLVRLRRPATDGGENCAIPTFPAAAAAAGMSQI